MNTELLLKVKEQILKEPLQFDMEHWECGTVRCIGGWAIVLAGKEVVQPFGTPYGNQILAENLLDLNSDQSDELFFTDSWPLEFAPEDENGCRRDPSAEDAAARIDAFIAQYGQETIIPN